MYTHREFEHDGFHGDRFWHQILNGFFGEVGDKTFFVTVVFAAWCPWGGIRGGRQGGLQRVLVCLGSLAALMLDEILLAFLPDVERWPWLCDAISCFLLALLFVRAWFCIPWTSVKAAPAKDSEAAEEGSAEDPSQSGGGEATWNQDAFSSLNPFGANPFGASATEEKVGKAEQSASYGSVVLPATSADGARKVDSVTSIVLAPVITFIMVYLAEADDKSHRALLNGGILGLDRGIGFFIGYIPAVILAVVSGFILVRKMRSEFLLFLLQVLLFGMCLISLTEALLHLGVLGKQGQPTPDGDAAAGGGTVAPASSPP